MKKIFILIMVLCFGMSMTLSTNVSAATTILIDEEFQMDMSKWTTTQTPALKDATATIVTDPVAENIGNKVLKIQADSGITQGDKGRIYPIPNISFAAGKKLVIKFDFYIPTSNGITQFRLGNILLTGGNIQHNGVVAAAFTKDRWNTCLAYYDYDDKSSKVFLNGSEIVVGTNIDTTKVYTYLYPSWMAANQKIYIDNIVFMSVDTSKISLSNPSNGSINVALNRDIELDFSNLMQSATINPLNIYLKKLNGDIVPCDLLQEDTKINTNVSIKLKNILEAQTDYTIVVNNTIDFLGVMLPKTEISFKTGDAEPFYAGAPTFTKNSNAISTLNTETIKASVKIYNNKNSEQNIDLIGVLLKDGRIQAMNIYTQTIASLSQTVATVELNVMDLDSQIELYLWDALMGENVLTGKYILDKNGVWYEAN